MEIDIDERLLSDYEVVEEAKPFREWLVPAEVLNLAGRVRLVDADWEE